jgi:hypothetical protein
MKIHYLYRISDGSNPKDKLHIFTKLRCLVNFITEFNIDGLVVFADNCSIDTIENIKALGIQPIITSLGNSGSFRYIIQYSIDCFKQEDFVYFVEDDYIHLPFAFKALQEGLAISDYVSLYDHPDKYINFSDHGPNPYIEDGGELTSVLFSGNYHWKRTNSTTMTFATSVKTITEDKKIWWYFTNKACPEDFFAFQILTKQKLRLLGRPKRELLKLFIMRWNVKKRRSLITPIPGFATHTEKKWLCPISHWHSFRSWVEIE